MDPGVDATGWTTGQDRGKDLPKQPLPASGGKHEGLKPQEIDLFSAPARGWLGPLFPELTILESRAPGAPAPPHSTLPPAPGEEKQSGPRGNPPSCTWHPVPRTLPAQPSRLTSAHPSPELCQALFMRWQCQNRSGEGGWACTPVTTPGSRNRLLLQRGEGSQRGRWPRPGSPTKRWKEVGSVR